MNDSLSILQAYFPVLIFIVVATVLGAVPLIAGFIIGKRKPYAEKDSPYECGFAPFGDARMPFDVRYYLIAILFIIFDLETAFLFPWAVELRKLGWYGMVTMGIFLLDLIIGFVYVWRKGALEWE